MHLANKLETNGDNNESITDDNDNSLPAGFAAGESEKKLVAVREVAEWELGREKTAPLFPSRRDKFLFVLPGRGACSLAMMTMIFATVTITRTIT